MSESSEESKLTFRCWSPAVTSVSVGAEGGCASYVIVAELSALTLDDEVDELLSQNSYRHTYQVRDWTNPQSLPDSFLTLIVAVVPDSSVEVMAR